MSEMGPGLARQAADELSRASLFAFTWRVFDELHLGSGDSFIPNWHVQAICHELENLWRGENRRLVITVPPRHLKSIAAAVAFPAWLLGRDPSEKVIVASYGLDLARKHAEDFRRVVESDWYRRLFPRTRIAPRGARQDEIRTTRGGGRKAVSIGGAVTGFGADYIVIDDLLKAGDASSETERLRAQDYIESSLLSRFDDPRRGRVVAIQQRLHEDDPAGYLLSKGNYRHLNLPAIAEEDAQIPLGFGRVHHRRTGDALFPQRMDHAVLDELRRECGTAVFNMQYQQNPIAADGSALRWEWFKTCDEVMPRDWFQLVVQSWDTGMSSDPRSDYSVCTTWGFREGLWYLLDLFRDRLDYPELKRKALALGESWRADKVLIERAGSGIPLLHECHRIMPSRFREIKPIQDKEVRFNAACAPIEAGKVVVPRSAPWLPGLRTELLGFPRARHDDQVDSVSQFLNWTTGPGFFRTLPRDSPYRPSQQRRETMRRR
ncbi:MAG: phage terminase large subunit [Albidovulum sp.]|uniref:phage terminase large subunit n=1 Tax=Albidovulum sp. TaxID=1872424 RepID=UPI0013253C3D|nr:phage terminase large subunit [Defluviimonas sp.]KAB2883317.1 MAG: phage terminase large subunit [Defluviimonas sp.]